MKKSIIRIICFCFIFVIVINYVNGVFKVKYGDGIYGFQKFYELKNDTVDVLMLGSSHAFEDFNTGVLWDEYGMASFMLGGSVQPMWNTYYYLKEALKTQTPRLILLEGYMTVFSSEYIDDSRIIKNNYGLKWSKDKVDAIKISAPEERWSEFLLEYTQYHTRYRELSGEDFLKDKGAVRFKDWKGFGCNMVTTPLEAADITGVVEKGKIYEKTEKYYRMIIELAQENNIPILVVISPYAGINDGEQAIYNAAEEIAREYNIPFINYNLLVKDIGIDFFTDAADGAHLNYQGNSKYTHVVGAYIKENYDIPDHRGEDAYQSWQNDADCISALIENQLLLECTDRKDLLEAILNENYHLIVSVDGDCLSDEDELHTLFEAIGISIQSGESGIYYKDNVSGLIWSSGSEEAELYVRLNMHDLCMRRSFQESNAIYANHIIIDRVEYKKVANGVNIVVYDTITQSVADTFGLNKDDGYCVVR